jgi:hypothetical protein
MKKIFISIAMYFIASASTFACDICGGSFTNQNPYLLPHPLSSYIGISFQHSYYYLRNDASVNKQQSHSVVLLGQYAINRKINLVAVIPFQSNTITSARSSVSNKGLGDISLLANFNALRTTIGKTLHQVSVSAGVKLATGKYNVSKDESISDQNFQLGTSSVDYLMNISYRLNAGNFSFHALGSYKYTNANKEGYRYGDVLTTAATAIYAVKKEKFALAPYAQVINEQHYKDANQHMLQDYSGGNILLGGAGLDVSKDKITFGLSYQVPIRQNLIQGELEAKPKIAGRISFSL